MTGILTGKRLGQIVILNGVSRSGKSSIAKAMQESVPGVWMNLGMDAHKAFTPPNAQPGVGLRAGGALNNPQLEELVSVLFAGLYESIAAHSRLGLDVVADIYHHEAYTEPRGILSDCSRRLEGLPVLFVGVRCPIGVIWERRAATWGQHRDSIPDDITTAVELGQTATHAHGRYDMEFDTAQLSSQECADLIGKRLAEGPPGSAFFTFATNP